MENSHKTSLLGLNGRKKPDVNREFIKHMQTLNLGPQDKAFHMLSY